MSGYVEALERWQSDAPVAVGSSTHVRGAEAELRPQKMVASGSAARTLAFAGIHGHERAGDVAASHAAALVAEGHSVLLVDLAPVQDAETGGGSLEQSVAEDESLAGCRGLQRRVAAARAEVRSREAEERLRAWLAKRAGEVDRVVLHVGPVLMDGRAVNLAAEATSVVLVTRARWTSRQDLVAARDCLRRVGVKLDGAVLFGAQRVPSWLMRVLRWLPRGGGAGFDAA